MEKCLRLRVNQSHQLSLSRFSRIRNQLIPGDRSQLVKVHKCNWCGILCHEFSISYLLFKKMLCNMFSVIFIKKLGLDVYARNGMHTHPPPLHSYHTPCHTSHVPSHHATQHMYYFDMYTYILCTYTQRRKIHIVRHRLTGVTPYNHKHTTLYMGVCFRITRKTTKKCTSMACDIRYNFL